MLPHVPAPLGYLVVFLLVAGESAGLPIPGETSLTTAAVLAARGQLDVAAVIGVAAAAAIIGDNIGYLAGRHGGRRLLLRDGFAAARRRRFLAQSEAFYRRRGWITVFVGRWLPVLRFTAALLAGANRMPWPRFLVWNALGGVCWATSIGLLAYTIGTRAGDAIEAIGAIGATMLILTLLGHVAWQRLRPAPTADGTP
ncbi:MAG TPA: DedA family protein [Gaiellales bacterium]|jgi:membrane protein DedA with SNARE-associated domain|nr:DedA family protein [Gaiellales bacterium]